METLNTNKESFEYWKQEVQRLEGELNIARNKMNSFNNNVEIEEQSEKEFAGYLKGKRGNVFSRLDETPENSFFRLFNIEGDRGYFEFYGDEEEAIANRIFSNDGYNSIKVISGSEERNATSVKTKKPGKMRRTDNGWEVTEPVEIELF
jgi:hypothetical protein